MTSTPPISLFDVDPLDKPVTSAVNFVIRLPTFPSLTLHYRRFCFVYLVILHFLSLATWEHFWLVVDGDRWYFHFAYFTNWALAIAALYFLSTLRLPSNSSSPTSLVLLAAALPLSLLCAVVYWASIFSYARVCHPSHGLVFLPLFKEVNVHGVSSLLLLIELLGSRPRELRLTWASMAWPVALGAVYHLCATVWVWGGGGWIYPFLDWEKRAQWLVLYATFIAAYALVMGLQTLRDRAWAAYDSRAAHSKAE